MLRKARRKLINSSYRKLNSPISLADKCSNGNKMNLSLQQQSVSILYHKRYTILSHTQQLNQLLFNLNYTLLTLWAYNTPHLCQPENCGFNWIKTMKNTFNQDIGKLSNIHDHNGKLRALKEISKMSKTHAILDWLLFQLNFHQRLEIYLLLKLLALATSSS